MKRGVKVILGVTVAVAVGLGAAGEGFFHMAMTSDGQKFLARLWDKKSKDTAEVNTQPSKNVVWYNSTEHKIVNTQNSLDEKLSAELFENEAAGGKWVILCHGYGAGPESMARYARHYFEKGFNVLLPYLRGSELGVNQTFSMGWLDKNDILSWIDYINSQESQAKIVLHGESMGAATVMMTVGEQLPENVLCAVEDCGYTSIWDEYMHQIKQTFGIPPRPLLDSARIMTRLHIDVDYKKASSVEQLKKSKTPMLFVHGEADDFVPFKMVFDCYNAFDGEKELLTVPEAGHARSENTDPKLYWATIWNFVGKYIDLG